MSPREIPGWRWLVGMRVLSDEANPASRMVYSTADHDTFAVEERVRWVGGRHAGEPCVLAWSDDAYSGEEEPDITDAATGGCLLVLLGVEAWRVRYSPSVHKQAAGTPWVADLGATVTLHATLGEACVAVASALGRWAET